MRVGALFSAALAVALLAGCAGDPDAYPVRPVKLYVPLSPGGATDTSARLLIEHLPEQFAGNVVVVNEAAGGGALAVNTVAKARPDGYSLLFFHEAMHTGYQQGTVRQRFDEFRSIGVVDRQHQFLLASAESGWTDLDDFVTAARESPGRMAMGVSFGGTTQYSGAMLRAAGDIDLRMLDTGNEPERVAGLLSGQLDLIVGSTSVAEQYLSSGDFVALAVTSEDRDPYISDVPTAVEQGYDVVFPTMSTLLGPADTPDSVVREWDAALDAVFADPAYREAMNMLAEPVRVPSVETPDQLRASFDKVDRLAGLLDGTR
ncbi:tripartite tricarboxylate transporter substrate binding protein [Pseudonocardia nematodicida]|uniref:Tripartite tricarboxylate transporter substrate binding protein n=1 Tax=Pseudonocardia nematodicida TaxID=1206997 RepID=A0ABV1KH26_9PSEU